MWTHALLICFGRPSESRSRLFCRPSRSAILLRVISLRTEGKRVVDKFDQLIYPDIMKFVDNVRADVTADIVYMMCPMHLLKLDEMISDLEVGQVLEVLTDYDGAMEDIPQWCRRTGNEFIGMNETEDFYRFYIRKTAKT